MNEVSSVFGQLYQPEVERKTDPVRQVIGQNTRGEDVAIFVAQAGNPLHEKAQREYNRALEKYRNNKKRLNEIYAKIIGKSILLNWEGVLDSKNKPIEASEENRIAALRDHTGLMNEVIDIAMDKTNFMEDEDVEPPEETTEKN